MRDADEFTIERTVRPGVWLARDGARRVLVREIAPDRAAVYRCAQQAALPIPPIRYVGPDASGERTVVVETVVEATNPADGGWRSLARLAPAVRGRADRALAVLRRAAETLAWLHAGGLIHGYLTPRTIVLNVDGGVCLAGLDCLQRIGDTHAPCLGYSPLYVCVEQLNGRVSAATDVRLLALSVADAWAGTEAARPGSGTSDAAAMARRELRLSGDHPALRLLEDMASVDAAARPSLAALVAQLRHPDSD